MSIKLRVMGGASAPPNFATITVNPSDTIATASVITALVEATKAAQTAVASAKISPVIKGKKGDPLAQSDTFSSRGVGSNDVLFVSLPLSSGKSKPPPPLSSSPPPSPPKAAPSGKALASPTKTTTGASPKTAPAAPVSMKKTFGPKTTVTTSPSTGASGPPPPRAASPPTAKSTAGTASPPSSPLAPKSKSSAPAATSAATTPPSTTLKKKVPPSPSSSSPASTSPAPSRASSVAPLARPSSSAAGLGSTKTKPPLATVSGSPKTKQSSEAPTPTAILPSVSAATTVKKSSSGSSTISGKSAKLNEKDSTIPLTNDSLALTNSFVQKLSGGKKSSVVANRTETKGRVEDSDDGSDDSDTDASAESTGDASSSSRQRRPTSTSKSGNNNSKKNNNRSGAPRIGKNRSGSISSISSSSSNNNGSDDDRRSSKKKTDKGNRKSSNSKSKSKEEAVERGGGGKADKGKSSLSRSKRRGSSSSGSSSSSSAHSSRSSSASSESSSSSSRKNKRIKSKKEVPSVDVRGKNAPNSSDSDQKTQKELAQTVEKELKVARAEMAALWEKQREDVHKQYEKQESERLAALKAMAEKEEQISKAQEKFISALQHRHEKETKNDEHLEELFKANRELREELSKRREASDKKLQELADLHAKNAILNPDTRVDNLLLVQTQIAQSLRAFNNLPSALLGGGSHREGASSETFGIAETTPLPVFLSTLGLERFLPTLRAQDITTSILLRMSEREMVEAGIDTLGARKRILLEKSRRELAVSGGGMGGLLTTLGGGTNTSSSPERSHQFQNPLSIVGSPQAEAFVKAVNEATAINSHYAAASSSPARDTTTFGSPIVGLGVQKSHGLVNSNNAGNNNFSQIEQLHVKVLKALFKKHEPAMIERAEAIVRTFNRQGGSEGPAFNTPKSVISDVYDALCLKYGITQTAYYSTLVAYLTERCPALLPAAHSICSLFEGREAEFCEAIEFVMCGISASSSLPSNYPSLWVQFFPNNNNNNSSSGSSSSYFYSSLCGLSQVKEPKRSTDILKVRDRQFSVSAGEGDIGSPSLGGAKSYHSVFLGPEGAERKTPGRGSSNTTKGERSPSAKKGGGVKALEKDISASTMHDVGAAWHSSPSLLPPNPNVEDDATSYDNMYVSMFAAFIVKKHPTKIASVPAILKDFKGRERDLLYQAQAGLLVF